MEHKKLFGTATVGTKGQVVIPAEARAELGIKTGDKLYVIGTLKHGVVAFIPESGMEGFIQHLNLQLETLKSFKQPKGKK